MTQTLYNGKQDRQQRTRSAELQVQSGREALRNVGQGVLLDAVTAYSNVLANQSLVEAQRANVHGLAGNRRHYPAPPSNAGGRGHRPTRPQAEARLSRGLSDLNAAEVSLAISQATYTQVIGNPPAQLKAAETVDRYLPRSREDAVVMAGKENPAVVAAGFDVDVATTTIRVAESSLLPTITLQGNASHSMDSDSTLGTFRTDQASVIGQVTAPIYDGGQAASQTRQSKELAAQRPARARSGSQSGAHCSPGRLGCQ